MRHERTARRPEFQEGQWIRFADGRSWSVPLGNPASIDKERDDLFLAIRQAEDQSELLQCELALTIHLLTKNYDLQSTELESLLSFEPEDPALDVLQREIHAYVLKSLGFPTQESTRAASPSREPLSVSRGWSPGWLRFRRQVDTRVSIQPPSTLS